MYLTLFRHRWQKTFRSTFFRQGWGVKILLGLVAIYFLASFGFLGVVLKEILADQFPEAEKLTPIFSGGILFYLLVDLVMYYAKPLPMPIFNYRGQSWLFDRFTDEVVIFNSMAEEVDRFTLVIDDDFKSPLIIQDYRSGELFALKEKRGMVFIHPIENRRIRTGRKVGLFAKETKLWQGKVFYIDEYKFLQTRASL